MKNWQILALCCTIIFSIASASYYIKHETSQTLTTNYGPIILGQVFSEQPKIDVILIDNKNNTEEVIISGASFYDQAEPVDDAIKSLVSKWKKLYGDNNIVYDEITAKEDSVFEVKIKTYITYTSSNFKNQSFIFNISEEEFDVSKDATLRSEVVSKVLRNFIRNKQSVAEHLFITDVKRYGLIDEDSESK